MEHVCVPKEGTHAPPAILSAAIDAVRGVLCCDASSESLSSVGTRLIEMVKPSMGFPRAVPAYPPGHMQVSSTAANLCEA